MKNNFKNIILVLLICLGFVSCSDFLDEAPPTVIDGDKFYITEQDARNAVDGVYERMRHVYSRRWMCIDLYTDDIVSKNSSNTWTTPMATHSITPSFELFGDDRDVYIDWWIGIGRANNVIHNVLLMDIDQAEINKIVGEARALRAFFYYNLVRAYGDMPIITDIITTNADFLKPRENVDEVYDQIIIPDLLFAGEHCDSGINDGRITRWAAKLILAEVYLTRAGYRRDSETGSLVQGDPQNYELARAMALDVVNNSPHSLNSIASETTKACGTAWDPNNTFSNESILEISYLPIDDLGNWMTREGRGANDGRKYWGANANAVPTLLDENGNDIGNTSTIDELKFPRTNNAGTFLPTPDLYEAYEEGDQRRDFNILTRYDDIDKDTIYLCQPMFRKFVDIDVLTVVEGTSFQYADNNTILFRYADALLIYAEAENEVNGPTTEAYDAVNQIRKRAFNVTDNSFDLTGLDQDSFRTAILLERRREFAGEYKRKFDLIRTNLLTHSTNPMTIVWDTEHGSVNTLSTADGAFTGAIDWPDHEWLWPIPINQMELNRESNWVQNFGY